MKSILCYGDSLTWGYDADRGGRHALPDRWPSVLAAGLGVGHCVIAEGLNGRTTTYDDTLVLPERNGAKILPTLLGTHEPLDLVILFLGTNDLKVNTGGGRAFEARLGMERLIEIVRSFPYQPGFPVPEILIVSPPVFTETKNEFFQLLFRHGMSESTRIGSFYSVLAAETGVSHFDAATVATTTPADGIHLDAANTRAIGEALVAPVSALLSGR